MENNNEQKIPESIWADGIPETIDEKDKINQEQLHAMAVDYITKNIFCICCVLPFIPLVGQELCEAWENSWTSRIFFCPFLLMTFLMLVLFLISFLTEIIIAI